MSKHYGRTIVGLQELVGRICSQPTAKEKPRYFAIVIKAEPGAQLGYLTAGAQQVGEAVIAGELPEGCKVTRAIEITEKHATETWI